MKHATLALVVAIGLGGHLYAQSTGSVESNNLADQVEAKALIDDVQDGFGIPFTPSDKWIGIMCRPVDESLRAHVSLPDDAGLLVEEVVGGSPAAEAGLERFDILVAANGKTLSAINDLIRSVSEAGDEPIAMEWVRGGKTMQTAVTPTARPDRTESGYGGRLQAGPMHNLRAWVDELEHNGPGGQQPLRLRVFGQAIGADELDYPADLRVQVQKHGNEPAKITVHRGDSS